MSYSSIGKRFCAALIDSLACSLIGGIVVAVTGVWFTSFLTLLVGAGYYILLEGGEWHATLGKKAMGIMVVNSQGVGIDYGTAALRYLGRLLSGITLGIGFIIALFNNDRTCLHDKVAGTYVVDGVASTSASPVKNVNGGSVVGVTGELAGMRFPITGNGVMIGRDPAACQIVLKRSKGVSRLHCLVSYNAQSGMYIVSDRNSTYGTFTGSGIRVTPNKSVALKKGERFYLATVDVMFEVQ